MTLSDFFSYGISWTLINNNPDMSGTLQKVIIAAAVIICAVFPYLLGSMNFAMIFSGKMYHQDIRNFGSGNAGTTNMMRTYGKKAAVITLLCDAAKAVVSGFIGYAAMGQYGAYIAGLFCIVGHMFPVYFRFKGGKGVVTAAVSILMCNPFVFAILFVIFILIVLATRYISLASVMCMLIYPIILNRLETMMNGGCDILFLVFAILTAVLVIFMHRENIKRLLKGKENKFSFKKSVKTPEDNTADKAEEPEKDIGAGKKEQTGRDTNRNVSRKKLKQRKKHGN